MLVALELAGWLNEANLALQAAVQIYGLLAPVLYFKIPSLAVVQVGEETLRERETDRQRQRERDRQTDRDRKKY